MRTTIRLGAVAAAGLVVALAGLTAPASALSADGSSGNGCLETDAASASARGGQGHGADHRDVSVTEQRAIAKDAKERLAKKPGGPVSGASVPVYVHVMAAANGDGNVTDTQITQQIAVLNKTFAGQEGGSNTGFTFTLAGTDRFFNNQWHADKQSNSYRAATRKGGANALNIWLVDFKYLGIATFPWDYARHGAIDGIRVHYGSLPGGDIANYNLGETATHEAGHWFGLYHTFQGGCTATNDEVSDTPAQAGPTSGCPEGVDTCPLPGLDPIHNYMDYSYDTCYTQFSAGQTARAQQMWTAYRA
jgi:hypothetical protein